MSNPSKRGRVTRADVARLAGVSVATVSYVLNGRKALPEATKERVRKAVHELGYFPDLVARSMSSTKSKQLGFITPNVVNPFYSSVLSGVEVEARAKGCTVIVSVMPTFDIETVRNFVGRRVDGVVCTGGLYSTDEMGLFIDAGIPVASVGFETMIRDGSRVPSVVADYGTGTRLGVDHLVSLGHRRIALLPGQDSGGRLHGWESALSNHGLGPVAVAISNYHYEGGLAVADSLLDSGATGFLVGNDFMALALMNRATRRGIRIPEDISVVGFDDIWMAERNIPSLTTIDTHTTEMGRVGAAIVLDPPSPESFEPIIKTRVGLVVRESTGAVPAR